TEVGAHRGPVRELILDTFGELASFYALADVAYVGNSLTAPGGGQNLLQPLAQGKPVLYGPHMQNFRDLCALAEEAGVGFAVDSEQSLAARVVELLRDCSGRKAMGLRALALIDSNQGAARRYADALAEMAAGPPAA